jgi:hypothetical protein
MSWRRRQESNLHASERGDLANRCHTVRRRLPGKLRKHIEHQLAEGTGLEPARELTR